ncbi:unnamed protein product [Prunus armeniaca]
MREIREGEGLEVDLATDDRQRWGFAGLCDDKFAGLCDGSLQRDEFCDGVYLQDEGIFDGVGLDIR